MNEVELKEEREALLAELHGQEADPVWLDGLVHDLKSSEASDINNRGLEAQVEYIYEAMGTDAANRIREAYDEQA